MGAARRTAPRRVKLCTFNVENLFARYRFSANISPERAVIDGWLTDRTKFEINDAASKRITARALKATDADILCLQEIEGGDALKRFRNEYLGGSKEYPYYALMDGNDPRRIDIAILSRFPIVCLSSWQHEKAGASFIFSRDCLEADIRIPNGTVLTVYNNHFKSMMGGRAETRPKRKRQVRTVKNIITDRFGKEAGRYPFVITGDFNDYLGKGSALGSLANWDQVENVVTRLPKSERWTHHWSRGREYNQLDYVLLSSSLAKRAEGPPHIERRGMPLRADQFEGARFPGVGESRPKASDHCPVVVEIEV